MKNIAFIFARGGSKGLPGKNIKPLLGKPLIQYSIDTAQSCPSIQAVFVSTDDPDIAEKAVEHGATVIPRPPGLATDTSPEWLSWRHAVEWVTSRHGEFDNFVSIPATSPLRSARDVEDAISKLILRSADVCISVTPSSRNPYFNMVERDKNGSVKLLKTSRNKVSRRQDAPEVYDVTTVVYVTTPSFILKNDAIFSGKVTSIVVPKVRSVDIDDIYDFWLAENILKAGEAIFEEFVTR